MGGTYVSICQEKEELNVCDQQKVILIGRQRGARPKGKMRSCCCPARIKCKKDINQQTEDDISRHVLASFLCLIFLTAQKAQIKYILSL